MKINRLEAHDRLEYLREDQSANVFQGVDDCLKRNPDSLALQDKSPYIYIFAHPRTTDDGLHKRLLWQPRLTRPKTQTNSYLFRAISKTDLVEICWLLPPRELWNQYKRGNVTEDPTILWSICQFQSNREDLDAPHPEDLPDERIKQIWKEFLISRINDKNHLSPVVKNS